MTAAVPASPVSSVSFGAGRRPETSTLVSLPDFDGPLGLLLALIESQKLDVLTVPLGALAGAYLEALATLEADRIGNVSSFVAVASQLILIKSRALLPRREATPPAGDLDEGVDPEAELRARLILYRAFRDAGGVLQADALLRVGLFRREPSAAQSAALAGSRPADAPPLDPAILARAIGRVVQVVPPPPMPSEALPRTITIGERAAIIRAALRNAGSFVLQDLLRGVRDRVVVAVTFLAMLELVKRREIVVDQAVPWGPIIARSVTPAERIAAGVPAEPIDAPIDESLESFA
ncbi:MAG TPA: ScpA family protein [Candidatus Acidoferrum sp.]|nr:ScpA family protein [Candidatus Acidoferrum sp.]